MATLLWALGAQGDTTIWRLSFGFNSTLDLQGKRAGLLLAIPSWENCASKSSSASLHMVARPTPFPAYSDPVGGALREGQNKAFTFGQPRPLPPTPVRLKSEENCKVTRRSRQRVTVSSVFAFIPGQLECPSSKVVRSYPCPMSRHSRRRPSLFHQSPIISAATDGRFVARDGISDLGDL